jgi:aryl-alcohol dehydrogenase-like predicted oxidoreductase
MRTRQLGDTDLQLTTIGLGTWAIGGGDWKFGWGDQNENDAVAAIVRSVELGVNWIDTAAVYGNGRSEELVARALVELGPERRPIVATKCGRVIQEDGSISGIIKRESVIAECEASLRRLGVETIDLYQMHWPQPDEDIEEAWQTMLDLKQQGKVRHIGVSNHSAAQMERLRAISPIVSLQPPYSMLNRGIEEEILPYCGRNQISVVCYSPMGKGLLTGAFTTERAASLSDGDHRSKDPKFREPQLAINLALVDGLRPIAQRNGRTLAQLSIAWVLRRDEVTSAIVGARRPEQIEQTVAAGDWELTDEEIAKIDELLSRRDAALIEAGALDQGRV